MKIPPCSEPCLYPDCPSACGSNSIAALSRLAGLEILPARRNCYVRVRIPSHHSPTCRSCTCRSRLCRCLRLAAPAGRRQVTKVEPPNWWTNFVSPVMVLLYGENLSDAKISVVVSRRQDREDASTARRQTRICLVEYCQERQAGERDTNAENCHAALRLPRYRCCERGAAERADFRASRAMT